MRRLELPLHGLLRMAALLTSADDAEPEALVEPIYRSAVRLREAQDVPYNAMLFLAQFARCNSSSTFDIQTCAGAAMSGMDSDLCLPQTQAFACDARTRRGSSMRLRSRGISTRTAKQRVGEHWRRLMAEP